jgi:RimJ/RimL family protein N-acetyltransferase
LRIETARLRLRAWRSVNREPFVAMCADPEVMWDYGGPIASVAADAKLERYAEAFARYGFTRWAVESHAGEFIGYVGALPHGAEHALGAHVDIGWRLVRSAWGRGFASEAANAALADLFGRISLLEVLAYTGPDNARSQAVMARLGLRRDPSRDFTATDERLGVSLNLVWVAEPRR